MEWYKLDKKYILLYLELAAASILYVFPIILADRYYNDDLGRSFYGSMGWSKDGRPLGGILFLLLCGGRRPIVDISPLPLFMGVLILSYSLIIYMRENLGIFSNDQMKLLIMLFIITNPLAISNLSYKYDSIMMLSAVSIAFISFSIPELKHSLINFLLPFFFGMMIMSLYQPAIAICIVLFLTSVFLYIIHEKDNLKRDWIKISGIISGIFFYMLFVAPVFVDSEGWRHEESKMVSGISFDTVESFFTNIIRLSNYIKEYIMGTSWLYLCIFFAMLIVLWGGVAWKAINGQWKLQSCLYISISPVFAFIGTFLPLAVLEEIEMRSRIFLSFGSFYFYIGVVLLYLLKEQWHKMVGAMTVLLLTSCVFFHYTYMYIYGNALKAQKEYEKYIVYNLAHDLEILNVFGEMREVTFVGETPRAGQVEMMCKKYSFLDEIVPTYLDNSTWLGGVWLYHYLQEGLSITETEDDDLEIVCMEKPVLANALYECYLNEERIIVYFP